MASPEGKKGGQPQKRKSHGGGNGGEAGPHSQLSLRAPVIRERDASAPVILSGWLFKQGSDGLMLWKKRWFVLSQYCLFYYHGPEEEKVLGSLLLPGYTIRPCLAGDRDRFVYRKYAFRAEHRNTRSFYLAAESRPSMIQWMNALSLAAILQDSNSLAASNSSIAANSTASSPTRAGSPACSAAGVRDSKARQAPSGGTDADHRVTGRQPLYANAPPKPRRLNTSRDSVCSSSPDASPERPATPSSGAMYSGHKLAAVRRTNGHFPAHLQQQRPLSCEVTDLMHQQRHQRPSSVEITQLTQRLRNSPQQHLPAERRTPDAYGRFKTEYEEVYNNSTTSASSGSTQMVTTGYAVAKSEVARRVPPRPHSVDFLQQQAQQEDYWASEEDYARQVRQSVLRNTRGVVRDPAEISKDIKESALWSYVQGGKLPAKKHLSGSQENLLQETPNNNNNNSQQFHRSASARLARVAKQPDLLNSSLADPTAGSPIDNKRCEQREESMKRLLEWKQRMLQSPLTRKNNSSGSGARSSERSTPTLTEQDTTPRIINRAASPVQQGPEYVNSSANFATLRRTMARAAQDLLDQEHLYQQQQQSQQFNYALRASLKRPDNKMQLDEEDEVRKEFTYEYVFNGNNDSSPAESEVTIPKVVWPRQSLMREKSSAVADLRARSESPSANRVLFTKDNPVKQKPKPPPKPSLQEIQQSLNNQKEEEKRSSYAESLPESLAGFANTIVSEDNEIYEPTVSPLISECDWPHNTTNSGPSPAPLPDLMSLASIKENVYVNAPNLNSTTTEEALNQSNCEDHYLPMTSTKLSLLNQTQSPILNQSVTYQFEENAYVEMTDNGKLKSSPKQSVFAGVCDPSYRSPESPRYQEINEPMKQDEQPHYEFIYKASSHAEPVYMEVPQTEEAKQESEQKEEQPSSGEVSSLIEHNLNESKEEEPDLMIVPPRHPRFSISDTFRPASFFLQNKLAPIISEDCERIDESSDSELVSPPPIPADFKKRIPVHGRSQSLDITQDYTPGRISRNSLSSEVSLSNLSRRRPLTIVRSLEDLLVDASEEQLAELVHNNGSVLSLTSNSQPVYENVTGGRQVKSPAGSMRQRLGSALSINSSHSTRSEQSAPYYYSDLLGGASASKNLPEETGSVRSTGAMRAAQAAKHAYQHSMDRLRMQRQRASPSTSSIANQSSRAQTPDLLANHPGESTPSAALNHRNGEVMRRVRSLEGLLDEDDLNKTSESRYAKDPTNRTLPRMESDCSPWDEDQLWRDKLRRASIRHTRSMDMLDEINESFTSIRSIKKPETVPEDPGDCYERLVQYSATLERTRRGQTYLDGYTWDEREQRFNKPGDSPAMRTTRNQQENHFLAQGLPPSPAFEIDREKLRQWDLMSTAPVPDVARSTNTESSSFHNKEGGRRASLRNDDDGGSSPVQAVAAGLSHATTGAAGKAFNGIRVAYQAGAGKVTSALVTTQQPVASDIYHSDPPVNKKGKLPPMMGNDQEADAQVPLSAGDLLGRTHEELVLLLIQLRRQSSALVKARDACLLEMESQVKLASLDITHRQECLARTGELRHHVKELEKQLEKLKPLISLVDNMVKLGSMSPQKQRRAPLPEASTAVKRNLAPLLQHQQTAAALDRRDSPTYTNLQQRNDTLMFHSTPTKTAAGQELVGWEEAQISQLESKHHQLAQLEKFVREEGAAIQRLTRNQQVLRLAIRGIRQQTNAALQKCDYPEVERCRQQQMFLERELSQIHSLLALSSKRLEDAAVEIGRIEREISSLHQQLHRYGRPQSGTLARPAGREMAWLEAELNRVQQHVSQLQTRRQELSSQVNRLTSSEFMLDPEDGVWSAPQFNGPIETLKRRPGSTWCETDMDSLNTVEQGSRMDDSAVYANTSGYFSYQAENFNDQYQQENYYDDNRPVDINEADERMKRYYGIVPKSQPIQNGSGPSSIDRDKAEIRTVRIVKRESEKRQRDKTKPRSPCDDSSFSMDDLAEEEAVNGQSNEDPIMDDPVLSQFSHILTLPRKNASGKRSPSQRNSIAESGTTLSADQWKGSLRPRRNLSSLSLGDRPEGEVEEGPASLDSTQRSPLLTPVYTSAAAREIVEEMRRQDASKAKRAVPRLKRRHITISCSEPLALEALSHSKTLRANHGRARDDTDLQRALRFQHPFAPDVVRSTISQAIRINEKTIDKLLCTPDKILIPERYVPEQEVDEPNEEEKKKRLKKTESIRRMLTGSAAVEIPRPPSIAATSNETIELSEAKQLLAKERQQRGHFIELNQMLVEEIKEKSKMAAATQSMESQYAA